MDVLPLDGHERWVLQWVGTLDGEEARLPHPVQVGRGNAIPQRPHKRRSWRRWLWWWAEPAVDKDILSYPAPAKVDGRVVTFVDGRTFEADVIVQATGYSQRFPFLHGGENGGAKQPESEGEKKINGKSEALPSTVTTRKNKRKKKAPPASFLPTSPGAVAPATAAAPATGRAAAAAAAAPPRPTHQGVRGDEDALPPDHFITSVSDPTLAFIGFVRPNVGAIPPMSELQVLWWIQRLRGKIPAKRGAPTYGLLGKKLPYGVDFGNYMHQLAAEMGAAPTLAALARSPKALVAWSLGQAYVTFFRLVGQLSGEEHWEVASGELYRPGGRRAG